ncbi:origin recognition complex subunit 4 Ecym_7207 [Eremothecium cymbalariae DBVPG|uniref:Origin recognition complex subunit 4 C-terminal domain-containing protein n=1 Tax=Eremothecium cymbalariae (strain CBS 270.75 / DBVPG 7215 / KCTC 17166 / NRRL Y-17582) TaxID=931890 RepID=G8JW40_ERECY|nr:hypothetical protein Ecym_7207 [Eremothecium cymbalariae DBVPG\
MKELDDEFATIKRSSIKVDPDKIIKDGLEDHSQLHALKKIRLFTKEMHTVHRTDDNELTAKQKYVLDHLPLQVPRRNSVQKVEDKPVEVKKVVGPSATFEAFKIHLLRKLNNTLPQSEFKLPSFIEAASAEVERILKQAIIQKESHSAILVSPRSFYKTSTINFHLDSLSKEHGQQFIVVKLNGFIHTENAAINSIATQLENELRRVRNDNPCAEIQLSRGSLTEVFENVLKLLNTVAVQMGRSQTTSLPRSEKLTVVFIFDEIDQFAGPVRQTLLYNLFDMVEHARVPVCILGCTTKLNILEYLEKRVKSRFSQKIIYVPQITNLQEFENEFSSLLVVEQKNDIANLWNNKIKELFNDKESTLNKITKTNYETFRDITVLKNAALVMVSKCKSLEELLKEIDDCASMKSYNKMQLSNNLVNKVKSLSDLELAILLSASRIALKNEENVNFNLTYEEYSKLVRGLNSRMLNSSTATNTGICIENTIRIWKKKDIKNIWETLIELELLVERGIIAIRQSAQAAFQATNHYSANGVIPYDLKMFQVPITLHELRRTVPKSSLFYNWTQL